MGKIQLNKWETAHSVMALSVFAGTRGPATELDLAKLSIKLGAQISHLHPTRSYPNLLESIFVNRFLYYHDQRIKGYII